MAHNPPADPETGSMIGVNFLSDHGKAMTGSDMSCFLRFMKAAMTASYEEHVLFVSNQIYY